MLPKERHSPSRLEEATVTLCAASIDGQPLEDEGLGLNDLRK